MNSPELKRCTKCGGEFPATGEWFYRDSHLICGFRADCKKCCKFRDLKKKITTMSNKERVKYFKIELYKLLNLRECKHCKKILPETKKYFKDNGNQKPFCFHAVCKGCDRLRIRTYKKSDKTIIREQKYKANWYIQNQPRIMEAVKKDRLSNPQKYKDTNTRRRQKLIDFPLIAKANAKQRQKRLKKYYTENPNEKKRLLAERREYRRTHKSLVFEQKKAYRKKYRKKIAEHKKEQIQDKILYSSSLFINLSKFYKTKQSASGYGQTKCTYCGEWYVPTVLEVSSKLQSNRRLSEDIFLDSGTQNIYCSESCKEACPTYNQQNWPKGFKKASSREVNPLIRQMCFKNYNYECQKCGATQEDEQLHCHHIQGAAKEPLLANDIDNVITLCKTCHKLVHTQIDCGYTDYRRPKCVEA